jgi:hypothetical protein
MPLAVETTTAEHVVAVVDAVLVGTGTRTVDEDYVAAFCQLPLPAARRALKMAQQLTLVVKQRSTYKPDSIFAQYLICANDTQRAGVFRVIIEQYQPFRLFRDRIALGEDLGTAADRVRAAYSLDTHRESIKDTLLSFGSFAHALQSQGAGLYIAVEQNNTTPRFIETFNVVVADLEAAKFEAGKALGDTARAYLVAATGFDNLAQAYASLTNRADPRPPILHAGNAVESFIIKWAADKTVNLTGATGINSRIERIRQAGHVNDKHLAMIKYLGHVRNAADHGVDAAIGYQWTVTHEGAVEYVRFSTLTITAVVASFSGRYIV